MLEDIAARLAANPAAPAVANLLPVYQVFEYLFSARAAARTSANRSHHSCSTSRAKA